MGGGVVLAGECSVVRLVIRSSQVFASAAACTTEADSWQQPQNRREGSAPARSARAAHAGLGQSPCAEQVVPFAS